LLEAYNVDPLKLDVRVRGLVYPAVNCSGEGQNEALLTADCWSNRASGAS